MLFTGAEWTTIGTGFGVVIVVLAAVFTLLKKEAEEHPKLAEEVESKIPSKLLVLGEDVGKFVENLATSPLFAGLAANGELESQHILGQLANSQAATVALQVLHAIGDDFSNLSPTDQNFAIIMARSALSKVAPNITDAQIKGLLQTAEEPAKTLRTTATFKAMQDLKSVNTEPAEEPAATSTTAPAQTAAVAQESGTPVGQTV